MSTFQLPPIDAVYNRERKGTAKMLESIERDSMDFREALSDYREFTEHFPAIGAWPDNDACTFYLMKAIMLIQAAAFRCAAGQDLKLGQWCWTRLVHLRDHRLFRVDPTLLFLMGDNWRGRAIPFVDSVREHRLEIEDLRSHRLEYVQSSSEERIGELQGLVKTKAGAAEKLLSKSLDYYSQSTLMELEKDEIRNKFLLDHADALFMAAYVSSSSEDRDELFLQGLEVLQVLDEALKTKIYDYLALLLEDHRDMLYQRPNTWLKDKPGVAELAWMKEFENL